jgi:FKBP-type peptidyl-prolyl cis-trans isomerase FklB
LGKRNEHGSIRKIIYNQMDKKSYAFGMSVASSFYQQGIRVPNVEDFLAGLKAMLTGAKPAISLEEAGEALEAFYNELESESAERNAAAGAAAKEEGEKFLASMAKDPAVKATGSGLMY